MRTLLLPLLGATMLMTGCSTKSALDAFKMDADTERAVTGLRTSTVRGESAAKAVISTVYLNQVYPERFNGDEYFVAALYIQDDAASFKLLLNGSVEPLRVEPLQPEDPLARLLPVRSEWNRYYLIRYPRQETDRLILTLGNDRNATGALDYHKDPR